MTSILIVADRYYPQTDGVLIFMREFSKRAQHQFDIRLMVPHTSNQAMIEDAEMTFLDATKKFNVGTYRPIKLSVSNLKKIKVAVQEADIVFLQEIGPLGYLTLHYCKKYQKKSVLYIHNTHWDLIGKYFNLGKFWYKVMKRFFVRQFNKCSLLMIPYRDLEQDLHTAGVKTKISLAKLGIDIERFKPSQNKLVDKAKMKLPAKVIIGYVGRISNEKNPLVLLDAFKKLNPEKVFLLMVGDGRKELVDKFKETKNCLVTGFVKNVEDYLKAMDIFVMPSLTETTSLATLEAMASGVAVVATKVGFIQDYLVKGHNGLFFPRDSSTMLSIKLEKLIADPDLRTKFGQNARKTVAYSFSWERAINRIKKLLLEG